MKKIVLLSLSIIFLSTICLAQNTSDILDTECRVQAKEAAVTTYQSCVKEARTQKIDEIRKEYQEKLNELKSHYDGELKKLAPNKSNEGLSSSSTEPQTSIQLKKKNKKGKKVANQLPTKKTISTSLPVNNIIQQDSVTTDVPKDISTSLSNSSDEKIIETEL